MMTDTLQATAAPIPPMTHPLSSGWRQPPLTQFLVDDTHAVMTRKTMGRFYEYSASMPSGVYEGKCWVAVTPDSKNMLRWYGPGDTPNMCRINQREILLLDLTWKD